MKYEEALKFADIIFSHPAYRTFIKIPFVHLQYLKIMISNYFRLGRLIEGLELLCNELILNEKLFFNLSNSDLLKEVLTSEDSEIQKNICTPILASIYRERINEIWIAYDNFMYHNNYTFPKELICNQLYPDVILKYFFRFVCIQDVYDSSPAFTSPEDLDNERIKICNYLCLIDSAEKSTYIDEITEIETRALVKIGIKEVDESKIFVDTSGIWREIENEVKERFVRGQEILKMNKEDIDYLLEMSKSIMLVFISEKNEEGRLINLRKPKTKRKGL